MALAAFAFLALVGHTSALMLDRTLAQGSNSCVVWHSQHKSAGATFENIFYHVALNSSGLGRAEWHAAHTARFTCDQKTWSCEKQTCVEPADFAPYKGYRLAEKGYVQVLAGSRVWGGAGDGKCVWATMFRDPIKRLVSAYLYCRKVFPGDPLCGRRRLDTQGATIQQFAEHWGNYMFREMLWFPELHALAASRPDFKPTVYCMIDQLGRSVSAPPHRDWEDPWVGFKDRLNGGDSIETVSGKKNFEAVKDHLLGRNGAKPLYDVIGVVEYMDDSLFAFDRAMPLAESHGWMSEMGINSVQTHGSENYRHGEEKLLLEARRNPAIRRAIAGDIELYRVVVLPMFHKQIKDYQRAQ